MKYLGLGVILGALGCVVVGEYLRFREGQRQQARIEMKREIIRSLSGRN